MNIFKHNFKLLVLSLFAFQGFSNAALADDHLHAVSGSVTGCSNKHAVHVLIYEESGFNNGMTHSQEVIINPKIMVTVKYHLTLISLLVHML